MSATLLISALGLNSTSSEFENYITSVNTNTVTGSKATIVSAFPDSPSGWCFIIGI